MSDVQLPEGATINQDGSVTLKLDWPVKGPDGEITAITIRRPKFKDQAQMEAAATAGAGAKVVGILLMRCAGLLPPTIDELDIADVGAVAEISRFFLERHRQGGAAS